MLAADLDRAGVDALTRYEYMSTAHPMPVIHEPEKVTGTTRPQGYTGYEFSDLGSFFFFQPGWGQPTNYIIRHNTIKGNFT